MKSEDLVAVWNQVERSFNEERINSERALQSSFYLHLSEILGPSHVILVEPGFPANEHLRNFVPDLIVIDRSERTIESVIEIKCMPHWWLTSKLAAHDMDKLQAICELVGATIELDMYGPKRVLSKDGTWVGGRPGYSLKNDTSFVFAAIARFESEAVHREKIGHKFAGDHRFILLSGAVDPENHRAVFQVT